MASSESYRNRIELLQGTLDMLTLQAPQWGSMHGYGIARAIRLKSSEVMQAETGSLYPALHRLEQRRWVRSEWKLSGSRQRAKFDKMTPKCEEQLAADHVRWQAMVRAIGTVMEKGSAS